MWLADSWPLLLIYESREVRRLLLPEGGLSLIEMLLEVLLSFVVKERTLLMHRVNCFKLVLEVLLVLCALSVVNMMISLLLAIKGL